MNEKELIVIKTFKVKSSFIPVLQGVNEDTITFKKGDIVKCSKVNTFSPSDCSINLNKNNIKYK